METIPRRWTIATWCLEDAAERRAPVIEALRAVDPDVVALQWLKESDARHIGDELDLPRTWALSHHPTSRLIPGGGIGLAILTPHHIDDATDVVISEQSSLWSKQRRIAQVAEVHRADHTGYAVAHAAGLDSGAALPAWPAPLVRVMPERVGLDGAGAMEVPDAATVVSSETIEPLTGAAPLLAVTFEMLWVRGDFPAV